MGGGGVSVSTDPAVEHDRGRGGHGHDRQRVVGGRTLVLPVILFNVYGSIKRKLFIKTLTDEGHV